MSTIVLATSFVLNSIVPVAVATTLYEQDFEEGILSQGISNPVWSLKDTSLGPLVGPGRMFEVISGHAHTGQYSLRFNYDGLNGICNLCGATSRTHKIGYDNAPYFIDEGGNNLTEAPFFAAINRFVYNKDNGYSKWRITSVDSKDAVNDMLSLEKVKNSIDGQTNQFSNGDNVLIARACGVDGTVGKDINRRSDCNRVISYFSGVSQNPGQSIYRRLYFEIDNGAVLPETQKLRYWVPTEGSLYVTIVEDRKNPFPRLSIGGVIPGMPRIVKPEGGHIEPGTWYYLEEQFKAETSSGANDGEYRLWFSKSGSETNLPFIEWVGIGLKPVKNASLWGNHQHFKDANGYWYIDDFKIANIRIGPESATRPNSPIKIKVQ